MKIPRFEINALPSYIRAVGEKLQKLGYSFFAIPKLGPDIFGLQPPPLKGTNPGTLIVPRSAMKLLLMQAIRGQLMLKMADPGWGNLIYGRGANFSKMAYAGCGPTSFAIIMNYLLRTQAGGSRIGTGSPMNPTSLNDFEVEQCLRKDASFLNRYPNTKQLVLDIVKWAGGNSAIRPGPNAKGKLSGTSGAALARNVKQKFQGFAAEIITDANKAVTALRQGELLMVGGRQRGWKTRESLLANPKIPNANEYSAHFVVLWGADQALYKNIQILWVLDPANYNDTRAIRYTTLHEQTGKSFIHVYRIPSMNLLDCLLGLKGTLA
jgi:hypothetical protein